VERREREEQCRGAYLLFLQLYLQAWQQLSERERNAVHLIEVEGVTYRDAALELGIKRGNMKMVMFRARHRMRRFMRRRFEEGLPSRSALSETIAAN